eukprot:451330-Prorocentrum_minimum.AAC.1
MQSTATDAVRRAIFVQHEKGWSSLSFHTDNSFASSGMLFFSATRGAVDAGEASGVFPPLSADVNRSSVSLLIFTA